MGSATSVATGIIFDKGIALLIVIKYYFGLRVEDQFFMDFLETHETNIYQ